MTITTSQIPDPIRVASRAISAGDVVPFRQKTKKPMIGFRGLKLTLSTHTGMLAGDLLDESNEDPRVIRGDSDPWKYLWVLDTDRKTLTMWRVTDGDEKYSATLGSSGSMVTTIDRKGELNRVDGKTFNVIEDEMQLRAKRNLQSLKDSIESNESDFQKQVNELVRDHFQTQVLPVVNKRLRDVSQGVVPIGFKYDPEGFDRDRQLRSFVLSGIWSSIFNPDVVEESVGKHIDLSQGDNQAVYWAVHELWDEFMRNNLR